MEQRETAAIRPGAGTFWAFWALSLGISQYWVLERLGPWGLAAYAPWLLLFWRVALAGQRPAPPARWLFGSLGLFLALSLSLYLVLPRTGMDFEQGVYFRHAADLWHGGRFTYQSYPFFCTLFMMPPYLASGGVYQIFELTLSAWHGAIWLGAVALCHKIAVDQGRLRLALGLPLLLVCGLVQPWQVMGRMDVLPVALCLAGVYLYLQGRPFWAVAVLAVGFWSKFFPALVLPPLVLGLWFGGRKWAAAGACALFLALLAAPFLFFPAQDILLPFRFQSGRDLTGETLLYQFYRALVPADWARWPWESITLLWRAFGIPQLSALLLGGLASWYLAALWALKRGFGSREALARKAAGFALAAPLIFVLLNRIYSEQFILWVLPFAGLAAALSQRPAAGADRLLLASLALAIFGNLGYQILGAGSQAWDGWWTRGLFWVPFAWVLVLLFWGLFQKRPARPNWAGLALAGGLALACAFSPHRSWAPAHLVALACVLAFAANALSLGTRPWARLAWGLAPLVLLALAMWNYAAIPVVDLALKQPEKRPGGLLTCCRYQPVPRGRVLLTFTLQARAPLGPGPAAELELAARGGSRLLAKMVLPASRLVPGKPVRVELAAPQPIRLARLEVRAKDLSQGKVRLLAYRLEYRPGWHGLLAGMRDLAEFSAPYWLGLMSLWGLFLAGLNLMRLALAARSGQGRAT